MKLLLHTCCGPCSIFPLSQLRADSKDVTAFFYNPNIHPYKEYTKRRDTFYDFSENENLKVLEEGKYGLKEFLQMVVFKESKRCQLCYKMRLSRTAKTASRLGFESFSTTLLYSRYQNHDMIVSIGEDLAKNFSLFFYYQDFRTGWQEGIELSKQQKMYRQPYCGCIYSEQERYDKSLKK